MIDQRKTATSEFELFANALCQIYTELPSNYGLCWRYAFIIQMTYCDIQTGVLASVLHITYKYVRMNFTETSL